MRTVIWDMGGTLVDTYPEVDRALADVVRSGDAGDDPGGHPGDAPGGDPGHDLRPVAHLEEVRDLRTRSIAHAIDILSTRYDIDPALFHTALGDLAHRWQTHPAPLMDGAEDLMDAVHRAGGLNLVATHRDRTSAEALLAALHVRVDDLVSVSDGFARKPDPQMYRVLLQRHGIPAADVLAAGDRMIDVRAGAALGITSALLTCPGVPVPDLGDLDPLVITSLRELLPLVAPGS